MVICAVLFLSVPVKAAVLQVMSAKRGTTPAEKELLPCSEWVTASGCALHDCHNSLKWSLNWEGLGPEVLKHIWVMFASVRNSFDYVVKHLGEWLHLRVSFVDLSSCPPRRELEELWVLLGVDKKDILELLLDFGLHWDFKNNTLLFDVGSLYLFFNCFTAIWLSASSSSLLISANMRSAVAGKPKLSLVSSRPTSLLENPLRVV